MAIPPPIDPRQLAAEIEAAVSEFNRLVNLATDLGLRVEAEVHSLPAPSPTADRPLLMVRVVAPL